MKNIFKSTMMLLCGAALLASCADDRDSNPVLDTSATPTTFVLNNPAIGDAKLDIAKAEGLELTWSQPVLTADNAPLGQNGKYGVCYVAQLSKSNTFTKSFDEALAEVTDADGTYTAAPTGHDYTTLPTTYSSCASTISAKDINTGLNRLNVWSSADQVEDQNVYIRMVCELVKTDGNVIPLAYSNAVTFNSTSITWEDVTAQPVEVGYLWVPGNGNGWSFDSCPVLVAEDGENYVGYAYMDGEFKFTAQAAWETEYNNSSFTSTTNNVDCSAADGGNIGFTGDAGMYWLEVNVKKGELLATPVTWSIIGGFNNWGDDVFMTYDTTKHCLTCTTTFDTDTEWKFRRDSAWTYNFGGSLDALVQDGDNLSATAGEHTIDLYIERYCQDGYHAAIK